MALLDVDGGSPMRYVTGIGPFPTSPASHAWASARFRPRSRKPERFLRCDLTRKGNVFWLTNASFAPPSQHSDARR